MRQCQAGQRLADDVLRVIDEFFMPTLARPAKNSLESILTSDWLAARGSVPPQWCKCETGTGDQHATKPSRHGKSEAGGCR